MIPLVYAQVVKYLVQYAAKQIAAQMGLQVNTAKRNAVQEQAPAIEIPDEAYELTNHLPVKELSEAERINRDTEYQLAQLEFRIQAQGLEEQRQATEQSRHPEALSREEDRRREESFHAEEDRKQQQQQDEFRKQDAAKQKEIFDEAGRKREQQERDAATRKEDEEKQIRLQDERRKEEIEKLDSEKAERERNEHVQAEAAARQSVQDRGKEERERRTNEIDRAKAEVKAVDAALRQKENAALEKFQDEQRGKLQQYARETGRSTAEFEQKMEESFSRTSSKLHERQEDRWQASEVLMERAKHTTDTVDVELLKKHEIDKLFRQDLDRSAEERDRVADKIYKDDKKEALDQINEKLQKESLDIKQMEAAKLQFTEVERRDAFEKAEAKAWEDEKTLRQSEDEHAKQQQKFAQDAVKDRFADDPEKQKEMQGRQQKVFEEQDKRRQEWQQERWREGQEKLAQEHQIKLAAEAENQRRQAEREREEAQRRAEQSRRLWA